MSTATNRNFSLIVEINFLNARSVVLFVCLLQGAIFAALLFRRARRGKSSADFRLGALLVVFCSGLITPLVGFAGVYDANQWLTYFPFYLAYNYGVAVYFYVLSLTDSTRKFTRRDLLLFVPAAVYVIFRLALFAQNPAFKDWFNEHYYVPFFAPFLFLTEFIWNLAFLIFSLRHYKKYRAWLEENYSDTERIRFDWLRNFLYVFTFVFVLGGVFDFIDSFVFNLSYVQYFYFQLILAVATYYLAVAGYLRQTAAAQLNFAPEAAVAAENTDETPAVSAAISAPKSPVAGDELERLKANLQNLMRAEKPYLEPQLTLHDLSKRIGINQTVLSYVINHGFGRNFNDFINEYRVEEIKEKLRNGAAKNLNLLGIAFECGFNSKATFNRAFKKINGISPKEFQTGGE